MPPGRRFSLPWKRPPQDRVQIFSKIRVKTGPGRAGFRPDRLRFQDAARELAVVPYRRLCTQNVVDFERLVDLGEPFGPICRATAASFVERQLKLAQQARDLFARRDMAEVWSCAEGGLVDVIESRQSARKELAIDHTLRKAVDRAKAKPERQFLEP